MYRLRTVTPTLAAALIFAAGLLGARPAAAQSQTFNLTYSGADFGSTASATGVITLDKSLLNNPGLTDTFFTPSVTGFVTGFSITVSGASAGNGTFGFSDYAGSQGEFFLDTNDGTLNFTKPLIGQPTGGDPYGTSFEGAGGDFNFFVNAAGQAAGAPTGTFYFEITTNAGDGDSLHLTSFSPAAVPPGVPEPAPALTFGLAGLGLAGLMVAARRRKKSQRPA